MLTLTNTTTMVEKKDQPTKDVISDTQPVGGTFMTLPLASATTPIQEDDSNAALGRLVEQYNRLAQDGMRRQNTDRVMLSPVEVPYSQYQPYWPAAASPNWWDPSSTWTSLGYPTDTTAYTPYLPSTLNILQAASVPVTTSSAAINPRLLRNIPSPASTGTGGGGGGGSVGGGRYANRGNCDCPNCREAERVGINNVPMRNRNIHNCHIAGCGKLYNKSSHLKAHLRWHNQERATTKKSTR